MKDLIDSFIVIGFLGLVIFSIWFVDLMSEVFHRFLFP